MYQVVKTTFATDRLEIKNNHIQGKNFKLQPKISRKTGKVRDNVYFTALILEVTSTSEQPFPIDMFIDFRGIFEFKAGDDENEILNFLKNEAVQMMFPYLRTTMTNLTTTAMLPPIILPIIDVAKLFPDNRETAYVN
ncbi:MAG: protein-export chaperone SecB [Candidatus Izemoplasmatales bacterium]